MKSQDGPKAPLRNTRISRRHFLSLAATGVGGVVLAACVAAPPPAAPQAAPPPATAAASSTIAAPAVVKKAGGGGTCVIAANSLYQNYVPATDFQGWAGHWVIDNVFEGLYTYRVLKEAIPALATGYTVTPDGLKYVFTLRQGVKFHDGTPFNADAVEFNYMRYLDKSHPFYDPAAVLYTQFLPNVTSVKALDDNHVEFDLSAPRGSFIQGLAVWTSGFMSPTAIKKYGVKDVGQHPVGTGRFIFDSQVNDQATLLPNTDYWGEPAKLDKLIIRAIPDSTALTAALMSGEVDGTPFVDLKDLDMFRKNPKLQVLESAAAVASYVGVNTTYPALQDVRARQAMAHAINKQNIIDQIYAGQVQPQKGGGFISPVWPTYAPELADYYAYDPNKAKQLLDQVGGPREFSIATQTGEYWPHLAQLIQNDLNAVGFKATISNLDPATYFSAITNHKDAIFQFEMWDFYPDPEDQLYGHWGCDSYAAQRLGPWCDKNWDALREQQTSQKAMNDLNLRKQLHYQLQKILLDQVVGLWHSYGKLFWVLSTRMQGFKPLELSIMFMDNVTMTNA